MLEREGSSSVQPLEYVSDEGVIGMNGARILQLLARQCPFSISLQSRLKDLGLSTETPPQRHKVEVHH